MQKGKLHESIRNLLILHNVESILRFGIIVWGSGVGIQKLLVIQTKPLRILMNFKQLKYFRPLFTHTRILTINYFYIYDCLGYVKKSKFARRNKYNPFP